MNTNCAVHVRNQAPGTFMTLWFSGGTAGPTTGLTLPGNALWLDPVTAQFFGATANVDFYKAFPVPAVAQLIEKQLVVQAVMIDPLDPSQLRTTNAKLVTLGY
jgi:hypothetical protein